VLATWNPPDFFKTWDKGGPFVAGVIFGSGITLALLGLVSGERRKRIEADAARERELNKQLADHLKRISALHDNLDECQKKYGLLLEKYSKALTPKK